MDSRRYYAVAEILGPDYARYPGNNEHFFLLFLTLIVVGWTTAIRAWSALDPMPPRPATWLARSFGSVLLLAATAIGYASLSQLVDLAAHGSLSAAADAAVMLWRQDPTASPSLVYALVPITVALAGLTVRLLATYVGASSSAPARTRRVVAAARA